MRTQVSQWMVLFLSVGFIACFYPNGISVRCLASDIERKPIEYSKRQGNNAVTQLQTKLQQREVKLEYLPKTGYLQSLLRELQVPVDSQTLVYSKTSLQRNRISPHAPRAIFFNDDIYIGYCRNGEVLEISVADPQLGTEFYTLSQDEQRPQLVRHTESCLACHGGSPTQGLPGHLLRSVYSDPDGTPILSLGSHRIDTTTPWEKRFGGWYVTGKHETKEWRPHLGNAIFEPSDVNRMNAGESLGNKDGQGLLDLSDRFDSRFYLSPHSDVVAHLVLTHQTHIHNLLTKLNLETQMALYDEKELNRELHEEGRKWESTRRRIRNHATELVRGLLFDEEAALPQGIEGTSQFTTQFSKLGKEDSQGRSLKQFDLQGRLMKYRCSYLIYSPSFADLPSEAKEETLFQLKNILRSENQSDEWKERLAKERNAKPMPTLPREERKAIDEILSQTLPGWNP